MARSKDSKKDSKKDAKAATDPTSMSRRQQFVESYRITKRSDPRIALWLIGSFLLFGGLGFALFMLLPGGGVVNVVLAVASALLFGLLGMLIVFGRRAQAAAYKQMEGQTGASLGAMRMLRRGWRVQEEPVAFTRQQDLVFRVVGPPGIVLVGEGHPARLEKLMQGERRRHERVSPDTPVQEVMCGREEGQVPLPQLAKHVRKMPKALRPADMTDVLNRLKAIDSQRSAVPMPKGPVPTSMKGMRSQMRGR